MNKFFYTFLIIFVLLIGVFIVGVEAANPFDFQYPIPELNNCVSQQDCKIFCDNPVNIDACVAFAESKGMIPKDKAQRMKKIGRNDVIDNGPGNCKTPQECDAYCSVEAHLDECLDFGVKQGFTTQEEAKKIKEIAKKGGPGGCKTKEQCDNFCNNPQNSDECLNFVVKEGKITRQEAEFLKRRMQKHKNEEFDEPQNLNEKINKEKVTKILKEKEGPGGCRTVEECGKYCSNFEHGEECLKFAVKNKIAPQEVLEKIKKISQIKEGPGGCKGAKECRQFCSNPDNRKTCFEFTKQNELISPEELKTMEKEMNIADKLEGGSGPGGCRGRQECDTYCRVPENMRECMQFAKKEGLLSDDRSREIMMQNREILEKMKNREEKFPSESFSFDKDKKDFGFPQNLRIHDNRNSFNNRDRFDRTPPEMKNMSPEEFEQMKIDMKKMDPKDFKEISPEGMRRLSPEKFEQMNKNLKGDFKKIPENMRNMSPEEFQKLREERMSAPGVVPFSEKRREEDYRNDKDRKDYKDRQEFNDMDRKRLERPEDMLKLPREEMRYREGMMPKDFRDMPPREDIRTETPQEIPNDMMIMPLNNEIPANGGEMIPPEGIMPPSEPIIPTEPTSFLSPIKFFGSVIDAFKIKF